MNLIRQTIKNILLITILLFLSLIITQFSLFALSWENNYQNAMAKANQSHKPLFVFVYRQSCMNCKIVFDESIKDSANKAIIEQYYIPLRDDVDNGNWYISLLKKIKLYNYDLPVIFILSNDGTILEYKTGIILSDNLNVLISKYAKLSVKTLNNVSITFNDAYNDYKNKDWNAALKKFQLLDKSKLSGVDLWRLNFYLGVLYYVNHDYDNAIEYYLKSNFYKKDPTTFYNIACAYSLKNDKYGSLYYLEQAMQNGYKDTDNIKSDPDLSFIRNSREIAEIISIKKGSDLTARQIEVSAQNQPTALEIECFNLVNQMRIEKGLKPLIFAPDLLRLARNYSLDMGKRNFFSHYNPEGLSPFQRMEKSGINFTTAGENIAYNYGYADAAKVAADGWRHSPGHYRNIIDPDFVESAIGISKSSDGKYFLTQEFIKRSQ